MSGSPRSENTSTVRAWVVRLGALLVFNLIVLAAIVLFLPGVQGAWGVLWAAVVLTAATIWIKPLLTSFLTARAGTWHTRPAWLVGKTLTYAVVYVVAFVVWLLTVILSDVSVRGFVLGYVLPPLAILVGWFVYDLVDDRFESTARSVYDAAHQRVRGSRGSAGQSSAPGPPAS